MQPGGLDLQSIVLKAQQMQDQMARAQRELAAAEVTGSAGGGLVTATVSGTGELKALVIDPSVIDPADAETLADLIVAAVRDARHAADALSESTMAPALGGLSGMAGGLGLTGLPGS